MCAPPPYIYVWEKREARVPFFGNNILGSQKDLLRETVFTQQRPDTLCPFFVFFWWPNEKASRVFLPWEELFSPDTDGVAEKKSGICRIVCLCFSSLFSFKICQILCTDYLGSLIPHTSSFVNHVLRLPFSLRFAIPSILHSVFMHCLKFAWAHWQGGNKW